MKKQTEAILTRYNDALVKKLRERNAQLEQEQEKFRLIIESTQEVFWTTDRTASKLIYISPAYETIWGRTCESLYKSPAEWNDAMHPDDRERYWKFAVKHLRSGGEQEFRILRPDGTQRWVRNRAFPIKDAAGRIYRQTGVATDITEEKNLAVQYQQAQKMEAIGRLAGGVAHDFNNLLTIILGIAELSLAGLPAGHPMRPDLEEIKNAGNRAAKLTQQLLAFSRRQIFEPKFLDLNQLVRDAERLLARIVGEEIRLEMKLAPDLGTVWVDPSQVEQVLIHLCGNARDAMRKGGRILVETQAVDLEHEARLLRTMPPGRYAALAVSDSGSGMSEKVKAHLFEPFFTTKPIGSGTGLGLATCFGIVKQSRGFIQAESEPGKGSRFTVYFPFAKESSKAAAAVRRETGRVLFGKETVLVAEDEPGVRRLTSRLLRAAGYTSLDAADAREALRIVKKDKAKAIRILVTDVVMPRTNGRELADQVKALRPEMRVLFTSGYPDETLSKEGVLEPGIAFLRKPFTAESLDLKIREISGFEPARKNRGDMSKILLVEDEGIVRDTLKAVLVQRGYDVVSAADGEAGMSMFRDQSPDLVILDRDIPKLTGSEVLLRIRVLNPKARVIVLTGNADPEGEEKYHKLGAVAFLSKGMGIEPFLAIIEKELPFVKKVMPRILVVDDEQGIRDVLRRFLELKRYQVETASNGKEALELAARFKPHLVLLDVNMPVMNGADTLKSLRLSGNTVGVIMISGQGDEAVARECMTFGACDYVSKPLDFKYLEESVWAKILNTVVA